MASHCIPFGPRACLRRIKLDDYRRVVSLGAAEDHELLGTYSDPCCFFKDSEGYNSQVIVEMVGPYLVRTILWRFEKTAKAQTIQYSGLSAVSNANRLLSKRLSGMTQLYCV